MNRPSSPLSVEQRLALLDVIDRLEEAENPQALCQWADGPLQALLPHNGFVCGIADSIQAWCPNWLLNHRFPPQYLDALRQSNRGYNSEMIERWRSTRQPVAADPAATEGRWWSDAWIAAAQAAGLTNLLSHGFVDLDGEGASYFCFIRIPEPLDGRHTYLMNRLVPYLHTALVRARAFALHPAAQCREAAASLLTQQQTLILHWLSLGKTNAEISAILGTSENNVKYHLKNIFAKLGVTSRAQAVAKAVVMKLVAGR